MTRTMTTNGEKSFVDTPCFSIYFESGSGGNFLTTLLYKFLYPSIYAKLSKNGNSHNDFHVLFKNYEFLPLLVPEDNLENFDIKLLQEINPIDKQRPVIYSCHGTPNFDKFFSVFPKGKIIIIDVPKEYKLRVMLNHFYKTFYEGFNKQASVTTQWANFMQKKYHFLKDIDDPTLLSSEEVKNLCAQFPVSDRNYTIPKKYIKQVEIISYCDIINDKNKVLNILSILTNKLITQDILDFYDQYLIKQDNLVKTKMPWMVT